MADGVIGIKITGDASGLQQSLQGAGRDVEAFGGKLKDSGDAMGALANGLKSAFVGSSIAVALVGLKNTVGELTQAMIQAQVQADKLRNGLNFAVGRGNAASELEFIRSSTKALGLEFVSTAAQYTKLAAAARGTSLEGAKVRDVFTSIAQASTVMGLSAQETEGALLAVQQMISKGKVQAEELRGQLGERLPGAFQVAARAMGVTTGELDKMLQTGSVLADDFLPRFAAQLTRETAPEVAAASKSMQASLNNLSNAWTDFKQTVNKAGAGDLIARNVKGLANDITILTEAMDRAAASGSGAFGQAMTGLGTAIARMPFDLVAVSANTLNGALNFLSFGATKLRTDMTLLPQIFETNAQKAAALAGRLKDAEASLLDYQQRVAKSPESIYLKSEAYQAYLLVQELRAVKKAQDDLKGGSATTEGIRANGQGREAWMRQQDERRKAQLAAVAAANASYATPSESLSAELNKQKEAQGEFFTPEMERKIREHFIKPMSEASDATKGLKLYSDLVSKASGYSADYAEKVGLLAAAYARGKINLGDMSAAVAELNSSQKANIETAKEQADAQKAVVKAYEDQVKAHQDKIKELDKSAASEAARLQRLQEEEQAAALAATQNTTLAAALEEVGLARVRETYAKEAADGADRRTLETLREEIESREKIITLLGSKEARTASEEAAKKAAADWQKSAEQIESSITDALMRGFENGKDFAANLRDTVVNMFKTMVLRPIVSAIVSPVAGAFAGAMGMSTAANAAAGINGTTAAINGASMLSSMKGWLTDFGGGVASQVSKLGNTLAQSSSEMLQGWGKNIADNATAIGKYANYAGYAMAAISAVDAASKGKWGQAIGTGIGAIGGPLGAMVGGAVGGWVDNAFGGGREYTTGSGFSGKFSNAGFAGRNYQSWRNDGSSGFFGIGGSGSSSGTNYSAMSQSTTDQLGAGFASIQFAASAMALSLGLNAQKVIDFSKDISVALSGDAEANKKAIADLFTSLADQIAVTVAPTIATFARDSETASTTLARLSTSIITVNAWLSMLRQRMYQVSLSGGDAASKLADAFGGLDKLATSASAFYESYYSSSEKVAASQDALTKSLAALGYALPNTKDQFRALTESLDLNTESGRNAYASLLQLAPQFAQTADLIDIAAKEAAAAMLKAFTGNGQLVPALNAAALSLEGVQAGADVVVGSFTQIRTIMLDSNSPVLTFSDTVASLSTELTGAQRSSLSLQDQIEALGGASAKAVIDFEGLSQALANASTTTFVNVIGAVFDSLAARIGGVLDSITTERVALREAALQIVNPTVMSKQSIQTGIAGIATSLPSKDALSTANAALGAANAAQTAAIDAVSSSAGAASAAITAKTDLIGYYAAKNAELHSMGAMYSPSGTGITFDATSFGDNAAYNYNASSNQLNPFSWLGLTSTTNTLSSIFGSASTTYQPNDAGLRADPRYQALKAELNGGNAALAAAAQKIVETQNLSVAAQARSITATTAQKEAATAASKALLEYQKAMQDFAIDSSKSVGKLSRLREETVKYFEAQKALADLMGASAAGLRSSVASYRYNQLSPELQAASLQAQFATAYSMAQASQADGTTLASYADQLNNTLGPLVDKLTETGQAGLIGNYLAQAEAVAKLLEDNAPKNYQADSLLMLGNIDTTLAALEASSQSAERTISDAIGAGSDRTAAGLSAVIAAITGQAIPAFATGAAFSGSVVKRPSLFNMGQMAEAGPEAIMPLANINGSLGVRMAGGGSDAMVQELRALRSELADLRAEARATAVATVKTAKLMDSVVRGDESINTVAA